MSETIYGIHAVKAFVSNHPERLIEVLALKGRDDQRLQPLINEIQRLGIWIKKQKAKYIKALLRECTHYRN